jgi:hypothetical protein
MAFVSGTLFDSLGIDASSPRAAQEQHNGS